MNRLATRIVAAIAWTFAADLPAQQRARQPARVQAQMRNVDFHLDERIIVNIEYLRGELVATGRGSIPYFDDKQSFLFSIDTARMSMDMHALSDLLNRYVFGYPGSPLSGLSVAIENGKLRQRARTRGITVTTVSEVSVTADGRIRLHPTSIKAAGIPVRGLMSLFGLRMGRFVNLEGARGVAFDGNDMLLNIDQLLPPPAIKGHLASVTLDGDRMVQTFRPERGPAAPRMQPTDPSARNYMYYRGGVLRFGRLTMTGVDLLIMDADQRDAFDFFLDRYNRQLSAGYSRSTLGQALIAVMPDFHDVEARARRTPARARPAGLP
jgi:hypothetical protein